MLDDILSTLTVKFTENFDSKDWFEKWNFWSKYGVQEASIITMSDISTG